MGGGDVSQDGSTPTSRDTTVRLMSRVHMLLVRCLISPRRWGQEVNSVYSRKKAQMFHYVIQHHRQERLSYMPSATHIKCDKPVVIFGVTDVDCVNSLLQNINDWNVPPYLQIATCVYQWIFGNIYCIFRGTR